MVNASATLINALLDFAIAKGMINAQDEHFYANLLLDMLGQDDFERAPADAAVPDTATAILTAMADILCARGMLSDTPEARELLDARIMSLLTPAPELVRLRFWAKYKTRGAKEACDWFYGLCRASNYIRVDDIAKNVIFDAPSDYGTLRVTINLTKPEKDPRQIAAERAAPAAGYPKCMLCVQNEGFAGRETVEGVSKYYPARQTLRTIPLELAGAQWRMQYSPYLYYGEHCIVLCDEHAPMGTDRGTFERLLAFVDMFPHYFIGANADLPYVGGSILSHDHFQGGAEELPMMGAKDKLMLKHRAFEGVRCSLLHWPVTTLRVRGNKKGVLGLAERIMAHWTGYTDEAAGILAHTSERHNAVTPIARKVGEEYVVDIALRNNRRSDEHPLGIFHPHAPLHPVKSENIGLIEVMGLFILPGRLKRELKMAEAFLTSGESSPESEKHALLIDLARQVMACGAGVGAEAALRHALAVVCQRVLEDVGVFKDDADGRAALERYLEDAGFRVV